ncbi:hypothetical protein UAJ10_21630 [Nitrospirillum sp. BR 11164]|uniref:hypothetical protein n=1 Tax=Nitrospirillum sp. BR 11164 TaxID=3104324 RepID=UPI002B00030B|nr:hypothetical protein [Nitrospirillum sp. BR 11164]MEA1651602.1 hypothetical protein [Nitrospirillum sp. BR 11164]
MPRETDAPPSPSGAPEDEAAPTPGEPPSLESLARRYLDLWQDQWAAVAADPDMTGAFARLVRTLGQATAWTAGGGQATWPGGNPFAAGTGGSGANPGAGAWMGAPFFTPATFPWGAYANPQSTTGSSPFGGTADAGRGGAGSAPPTPPGPPAAGDAPDGGDGRLAELAGRITALERQLADLAQGAGTEVPPTARRPRRRRPGSAESGG